MGVQLPIGEMKGPYSLRHRVQSGNGAYPTSYPTGTDGTFPEGRAAVA